MSDPIKKKEDQSPVSKKTPIIPNTGGIAPKIPIPAPASNSAVSRSLPVSASPQDWESVDKRKFFYVLRIGDAEFSNLDGSFLGRPYLRKSSYQHNTLFAVLNDPRGEVLAKIVPQAEVVVEVGFAPGNGVSPVKKEKFRGKVFHYGPKKPDGCQILAADESYELQSRVSPGVTTTSQEVEVSPPPKDEISQMKVVNTFSGEASFYGGGDGFDGKTTASGEKFDATKLTAAHKTLPFNTLVRVTNTKNNKSVVVRINDRGPYAKGRIIDLSKSGAEAIEMIESGHAPVKVEVLGENVVSPNKATPQTDPKIQKMVADKAQAVKDPKRKTETTIEAIAKESGYPAISNTVSASKKAGEVRLQQSDMGKSADDARKQGDVIISNGGTLQQVAPGQGEPTELILDYKAGREAFVTASLIKMTGLQLKSGFGQITVSGWNINDKTTVGATVVTPLNPPPHPTGIIQVPAWGQVKLNESIVPGGIYTWADATKNGTRIPTREIMQRIAAIAQVIEKLTEQTVGKGKKWTINSWYRDPATNRRIGGATNSRHLYGDAIDFIFPGAFTLHDKLRSTWNGGLAKKPGSFVHIDLGSRRRWNY